MGGKGSGGHTALSDEEKKRRGTFRQDQSEAARAAKASAKIVTGPWLSKVPEPDYPLNTLGKKKYNEWTKELLRQNKLTLVTAGKASALALLVQKIHRRAELDKDPSASDLAKYQSLLRELDIATNATVTASPDGARNRYIGSGFSASRTAKVSIRSSTSPRTGE